MDVRRLDPHYKKTLVLHHGGRRLEFRVAQDLFSSHEVDVGTRLLLRTLTGPEHRSRQLVLDLGCGYGPIGLGLKATSETRTVHMVDRDALAVEFARDNARLNGFDDLEVYGSLGYQDLRRSGFELIASNIPAKAGAPVIEHFLLGAAEQLAPGGLVAIVVIAPLEPEVAGILEGRADVEIVYRRRTATYAVFHYRFSGSAAAAPAREPPPLGPHERQAVSLTYKGIRLVVRTAYGLPEFDSLSFVTELAADALLGLRGRPARTALVFNPGQGHLAVLGWRALTPDRMHVVDRDLLALRFTEANLLGNGCPPDRITVRHQAGLEGAEAADVAVGVLRPREPPESVAAAARQAVAAVRPGGRLILGASSTVITRCLAALAADGIRFTVVGRRRNRGYSAVVVQRS